MKISLEHCETKKAAPEFAIIFFRKILNFQTTFTWFNFNYEYLKWVNNTFLSMFKSVKFICIL